MTPDEFREMASRWSKASAMLRRGASVERVVEKHPWTRDYLIAPEKKVAENRAPPPPPPPPRRIPRQAAEKIHACMGLTEAQVDTVMSLVSLAENGTSKWWEYYNYIEHGADASIRGYTTTIFGATSGTGSLLKVFDALQKIDPGHALLKYHPALKRAKGGVIKGLEGLAHVGGDPSKAKADYSKFVPNERAHLNHIEGDLARLSSDDGSWKLAVWDAFIDLNWLSASAFCSKTGACASRPGPVLTTPLAKGYIVDVSLNHGDCTYWKDADTWKAIWKAMATTPHPRSEGEWLVAFNDARRRVLRSGYMGLDWSKSGDRCLLWRSLIGAGNWDLRRPITVPNSTATPYPIWASGLTLE